MSQNKRIDPTCYVISIGADFITIVYKKYPNVGDSGPLDI